MIDLEGRPVSPAGAVPRRCDDLPRDAAVLSYSQIFVNPAVETAADCSLPLFAEDTLRATTDVTLTLGARWDYDSVTDTPGRRRRRQQPRAACRRQLDAARQRAAPAARRLRPLLRTDSVRGATPTRCSTIRRAAPSSVTFAPGTPFAPPAFPNALPRDAFQNLPLSQLPPRNVQVFDPDLRSPWTEQVSAGYVFTPPGDSPLAVDYVHNRGRNLIRRIDTNAPASVRAGVQPLDGRGRRHPADRAGGRRLPPDRAGRVDRPQPVRRAVSERAQARCSRGVAFDVAYTLSRIENDTDDINFRPVDSRAAGRGAGAEPQRSPPRAWRSTAWCGCRRLVDVVPVLFLSSGQPLNVTTGRDDNGDTIFNDRPAGVARNSERTAGFAQFDLGLRRDIPLGPSRLQLRADVFNVFNRTNFSGFFNYGASGVRPDEAGRWPSSRRRRGRRASSRCRHSSASERPAGAQPHRADQRGVGHFAGGAVARGPTPVRHAAK